MVARLARHSFRSSNGIPWRVDESRLLFALCLFAHFTANFLLLQMTRAINSQLTLVGGCQLEVGSR